VKNSITTLSVLILLSVLTAASCRKGEPFTTSRLMMGTLVNITVVAMTEKDAALASSKAFDAIGHVEDLMSPKRQGSDVARINRLAGRGTVVVSDDTFGVIKQSTEISRMTDGAFDVSFAALSPLWDFSREPFTPPGKPAVADLLPLVDYRAIVLDEKTRGVRFSRTGMHMGLGGIAKGYGIRKAVEALSAAGVKDAIVDAGGDLKVIGKKQGENWRVGLMHPRDRGIILSIVAMPGDAVVTSGDYERFAIHDGVRYHHILDPKTGFPARGLISVTVIGRDPVDADAYATAFFVMGREKAVRFLGTHASYSAILIDESLRTYASRALRARIAPMAPLQIEWF
jgi:FAD:protein FMN transferase